MEKFTYKGVDSGGTERFGVTCGAGAPFVESKFTAGWKSLTVRSSHNGLQTGAILFDSRARGGRGARIWWSE